MWCKYCEQEKPDDRFIKKQCKDCVYEKQRLWSMKNRDKATAIHLRWAKKNPKAHNECQKRWREKNKEKYNEYHREYQRKLREKKSE